MTLREGLSSTAVLELLAGVLGVCRCSLKKLGRRLGTSITKRPCTTVQNIKQYIGTLSDSDVVQYRTIIIIVVVIVKN